MYLRYPLGYLQDVSKLSQKMSLRPLSPGQLGHNFGVEVGERCRIPSLAEHWLANRKLVLLCINPSLYEHRLNFGECCFLPGIVKLISINSKNSKLFQH
ncbi:hypothetical protein OUZ56_033431 [Daphnia magna]|uniref:Uncharacterized protein n=1 Tax=Daphnia magna TaxID=35525 RepID=A0ABR0BAP8_9CRUS|nr:hypothetical protein OUZ56_033431 [Daphnia magna]